MANLHFIFSIIFCVLFGRIISAATTTSNSSYTRTTNIYRFASGFSSTWSTENPVVMNGWKMKVILSIKGFYFGFFCYEVCDSYLLSVVAVGGDKHNAVWSAKTADPVRKYALLRFTTDPGLSLRDSDGITVWSSVLNPTANSTSPAGFNLTEAGNLVIFDANNIALWQSFDHPVDALLVGQRLYRGQTLAPSSFETSWRESSFFAAIATNNDLSGFMRTGSRGNRSLMYYELGLNRSSRNTSGLEYLKEGNREFVVNSGRFEVSLQRRKYVEYVRLGADGRLRSFRQNVEGSDSDVVDVVAQRCMASKSGYLMEEVTGVTYSNTSSKNDSAIVTLKTTTTTDKCKEACLRDCNCVAVVFSDGDCLMPSEIFSGGDNTTVLKNSLTFAKEVNGSNRFVNDIPTNPPPKDRKRKNLVAIVSGSISGGIIVILLVLFCVAFLWKKRTMNKDDDMTFVPGMPSRFSYKELIVATDNFKEILGSGGFGSVFKGVLEDGTIIAVKRLDKMSHGMREFLAEVETIGRLHHFNLVRLVGFCAEKSCRLLVYEHVVNGSLDKWIFSNDQKRYLDWKTRKKIVLDVAKGLAYLHEDCRQKIIHLDIKPHNILLDENFNAKVSDFGLSALIERNESQILMRMRGTPGYLAPEWKDLRATVKVDVYSFGIVLLELISQRKNVEMSRSEASFHLLKMLQRKAEEDRIIEIVESLDQDMKNNREEVARMIKIGAWCLQDDPEKRPFMSTVVKVLEGVMEVDKNIRFKFSHALSSVGAVANEIVTLPPIESVLSAPR